jgi:hypothetical protein
LWRGPNSRSSGLRLCGSVGIAKYYNAGQADFIVETHGIGAHTKDREVYHSGQ